MTLVFIFLYVIFGILGLVIILFALGRHTFWLPIRDRKLPRLVMLHQVTPHELPSGMNMPPERFERLLQILQKQGRTFVTMSELVSHPMTPYQVALTFDDGFADNYHYAFPLLKKYQAKATIYLAPDIPVIDKLQHSQILEMAESGLIEFGAHSVNHVNLTKLDDTQAIQEIEQSRDAVQRIVGSCRSFAYPYGRFDERHEKMVEAAGFTSAVSTRKKIEPISSANIFRLPRVSTHGKMSAVQMRIALARGRYRI
ncbi:MAG: polysaccharide deacetylase family protein [Candidatus Saccharibacteria bacterium]|nr:polysaccharide deacetylase family protein [Moraxellaceae bacterium]